VIHRITESASGDAAAAAIHRVEVGTVAKAGGELKYVVCNGDEGDPARSWIAA